MCEVLVSFVTLSTISTMDFVPFEDSDDNYKTNINDEKLQELEEDILIVYTMMVATCNTYMQVLFGCFS